MALKTIKYPSPNWFPIIGCEQVALCLDAETWAARILSPIAGAPLIYATVRNHGRYLGYGGGPHIVPWENPRGSDLFLYDLEYDDTQIDVDPATQEPYIVTCADIKDILSACLLDALVVLHPPE